MSRASNQTRRGPANGPDLYDRVTNQILADLARGVRPWTRPWNVDRAGVVTRPLRHNLVPYSGVNVLLLWSRAIEAGYNHAIWMTFRQARELGGCVRKGEKGATIVYAGQIVRAEQGQDGEDIERRAPFLKTYSVFNVAQIDGLPASFHEPPPASQAEPIAAAEAFFAACGASVIHGGDHAYYRADLDCIHLPPFEAFHTAHDYYATLAHELVHWTRHPSRLGRDLGRKAAGDAGYAREELVAELGAAFLCADLGLELTPRADHAEYIGHWLEVLGGDKRAIFSAAGHAQRAADFLAALQRAA
jgi:antirestriction protein ArdC